MISQTLSKEDKKAEKMINVPPKTVAEIMNHIAKVLILWGKIDNQSGDHEIYSLKRNDWFL